MFLLLTKIEAKDFFLTENEFQDVLKEYGITLFNGFPVAPNKEVLEFLAIEGCVPGDIIEYSNVHHVYHNGYGEINP